MAQLMHGAALRDATGVWFGRGVGRRALLAEPTGGNLANGLVHRAAHHASALHGCSLHRCMQGVLHGVDASTRNPANHAHRAETLRCGQRAPTHLWVQVCCAGLAPEEDDAYANQRLRWVAPSAGGIHTSLQLNPSMWGGCCARRG